MKIEVFNRGGGTDIKCNSPIAILELPTSLSHEWLTLLKRCHWLIRQEYVQ